jgi:hypothetical protein
MSDGVLGVLPSLRLEEPGTYAVRSCEHRLASSGHCILRIESSRLVLIAYLNKTSNSFCYLEAEIASVLFGRKVASVLKSSSII